MGCLRESKAKATEKATCASVRYQLILSMDATAFLPLFLDRLIQNSPLEQGMVGGTQEAQTGGAL